MWAPKTNRRGTLLPSYENMTQIREGDVIFSFAGKEIKAIGVALTAAYTSVKPRVFEKAGEAWNDDGWRVDVLYVLAKNPIQPRNHMEILAPLLPSRHSPIRADGSGNQVYLCEVNDIMGQALLALTSTSLPEVPALKLSDLAFDSTEQELVSSAVMNETVKATLVQARRGQGLFRSRVLTIERKCRVTGVQAEKFLIASHIKPWSQSENDERLDGNNGLFLSPHVDKLFDGGFISFTAKGEMIVSPLLDTDVLEKWSIDPSLNYGRFNKDQEFFLAHHANKTFKADVTHLGF
jgi:hypothetical protein